MRLNIIITGCLLVISTAMAIAPSSSTPPAQYTVNGVGLGVSEAEVYHLLQGLTVRKGAYGNGVNSLAVYEKGLFVYLSPRGRVVRVQGTSLERDSHILFSRGDPEERVEKVLGDATFDSLPRQHSRDSAQGLRVFDFDIPKVHVMCKMSDVGSPDVRQIATITM